MELQNSTSLFSLVDSVKIRFLNISYLCSLVEAEIVSPIIKNFLNDDRKLREFDFFFKDEQELFPKLIKISMGEQVDIPCEHYYPMYYLASNLGNISVMRGIDAIHQGDLNTKNVIFRCLTKSKAKKSYQEEFAFICSHLSKIPPQLLQLLPDDVIIEGFYYNGLVKESEIEFFDFVFALIQRNPSRIVELNPLIDLNAISKNKMKEYIVFLRENNIPQIKWNEIVRIISMNQKAKINNPSLSIRNLSRQ